MGTSWLWMRYNMMVTPAVGTALKEGLPLKLSKVTLLSAAVVCGHKSGSSSVFQPPRVGWSVL